MKKTIILVFLLLPLFAFGTEDTGSHNITQVNIDNQGGVYLLTDGYWGAPSCPKAIYVYIPPTLDEKSGNKMFSLALFAKSIEKSVYFSGTCAGTNDFIADYMVMNP